MKIKIKVKPNSSREKVVKNSDVEYDVWVKEKPVDGKANIKLVEILKRYFGTQGRTPRERVSLQGAKEVKIKSGFTSRRKIIEVEDYSFP